MTSAQPPQDGNGEGVVNLFAGTEGIYNLPHHAKEIERLRNQHAFLLSATGGAMLLAPIKQRSVKVLDCGAADGTWLLDLARRHPQHDWSLHGVDIGGALFPPKTGPHAALDLREFDIRSAAPPDPSWTGSFDLVHQRLLIWGLQAPDWPVVVRNHAALLKPGGWIQLAEVQWFDRDRPLDDARFPYITKMYKMALWTRTHSDMDIFVADRLEDLVREAGFENVQRAEFDVGYGPLAREAAWREKSVDLQVDAFRGFATKLPKDGSGFPGVARDAAEYARFLDGLRAEMLEHGFKPKLFVVIGQKPE
ncbi:a3a323fe-6d63-44dc-8ac0-9f720fc8c6c6 [Thermothielavioides terrestris]|uniref:Methyltransferase domain-containing protein n=2 Tax=Thermothielavioides terrestris TaxID=2587410 RepID=G2QTZ7_THETT|nr:uncharacterized protein THITE_2109188 [Thermothielavioides terrestris NRRL 8126]AEO63656.1 hypothetical protein THITE_2109188 [Thermothielavioides terrestris NRRL 8126]SPQ20848.1 a3a323fe-6d63-44dc-8ac0-9f720fc8c6c6 [Thermothielavioides terrestris]